MVDTFNGWNNIKDVTLDEVANLVITGKTATEICPDSHIFTYFGTKDKNLTILDFGCGIGRNIFSLSQKYPNWKVIGYDNDNMLEKAKEYCDLKYKDILFKNLLLSSDWNYIKSKRIDVIYCCLVLQHIYVKDLIEYIEDFKRMTSKLVVKSRRYNDDPQYDKISTWSVLDSCKIYPDYFYIDDYISIKYSPNGHPDDHNLAIYQNSFKKQTL